MDLRDRMKFEDHFAQKSFSIDNKVIEPFDIQCGGYFCRLSVAYPYKNDDDDDDERSVFLVYSYGHDSLNVMDIDRYIFDKLSIRKFFHVSQCNFDFIFYEAEVLARNAYVNHYELYKNVNMRFFAVANHWVDYYLSIDKSKNINQLSKCTQCGYENEYICENPYICSQCKIRENMWG